MVLKKSKFGGNTGNTLRKKILPEIKSLKRFQSDTFVSENANIGSKKDKNDGDAYFSDVKSANPNHKPGSVQHVKYSMKKQKRWMLPDMLDETFDNQQQQMKVQLLEIVENDYIDRIPGGYDRQVGISLIKNSNGRNERNSKSFRPNNIKVDRSNIDIEYTVYKTRMTNTWPKFQDSHIWKGRWWSRKADCRNSRVTNSKRIKNQLFEYGNDHDNEIEDCIEMFDDHNESSTDDDYFLNFKELLNKPHTSSSETKDRLIRTNETAGYSKPFQYEKGSYKVIDTPTIASLQPMIHPNDDEVRTKFSCKIHYDQIAEHHLQERFGDLYKEGQSHPRKFLFVCSEDPFCQKLLVNVLLGSDDDEFIDITITFLNFTDIEDLIEALKQGEEKVDFYNLVSMFLPDHKVVVMNKTHDEEDNNNKDKGNDAEMLNRIDVFRMADFYDKEKEALSSPVILSPVLKLPSECHNCLCEAVNFTTLYQCHHSFCNDCWKTYTNLQVTTVQKTDIKCLAYKCKSKVDIVTIINFLTLELFDHYVNKFYQNFLLQTKTIKTCPTKACSSIIKIDDSLVVSVKKSVVEFNLLVKTAAVKCDSCKKEWCFNCQSTAHLPISCKIFQRYCQFKEKLHQSGIVDEHGKRSQTKVFGKHCPFCGRFIEKNGGCSMMYCICSPDVFCWRCLKPFLNDGHYVCKMSKEICFTPTLSSKEKKLVYLIDYDMKCDHLMKHIIKRMTNSRKSQTSLREAILKGVVVLKKSYRIIHMFLIAKEFSPSTMQVSVKQHLSMLKFITELLKMKVEEASYSTGRSDNVNEIHKLTFDVQQTLNALVPKQ